jgi:hypothetical protein
MHDNVFHIVRKINYFILFYKFIYLDTCENRLNSISEHHLITNVPLPRNDLERERGGNK